MKLKTTQKGLATVEAAIILPVFLLVMFAIMEFGIILYDKAVITNASREAARSGIALRNPKLTTAQISAVATNYCTASLANFNAANLTVTANQSAPPNFGTPLSVNVSYRYNFILGNFFSVLSGGVIPNSLTLLAQTTMNNE
jgi:Flp pilus assembly protein TadG